MLKAYSSAFSSLSRLVFLASLLGLSACNQYQDNGLLSDAKEDVCPPGCSQNIKADDSQISIKIMNSSPVTMVGSDTRVDISGECYPSIYPTNKITVSILNNSNGSFTATYYGIDPANVNNVSCKNGRFNFALDTSTLPAGAYNIRATLLAYTSSGVEHRNDSDGSSYVSLRK